MKYVIGTLVLFASLSAHAMSEEQIADCVLSTASGRSQALFGLIQSYGQANLLTETERKQILEDAGNKDVTTCNDLDLVLAGYVKIGAGRAAKK